MQSKSVRDGAPRKLIARDHAAPPRLRRAGGERSGRNSGTLRAGSGSFVPLCSVFAATGTCADPIETPISSVFPRAGGVPRNFEAQSGGLRFDDPPFDVWATNITPDRDSGVGNWTDAEIKTPLKEGKRPAGHQLAEVMPSGFYKILTPRDLDGIVAYLRSLPPVGHKVPAPVYKMQVPHQVFPGAEKPMSES